MIANKTITIDIDLIAGFAFCMFCFVFAYSLCSLIVQDVEKDLFWKGVAFTIAMVFGMFFSIMMAVTS